MIKKFEFISKSSTLKKLKLGIKQSRILPIYSFSINEWKNNKKNILTEIRKKFTKKIIIRSSVIGEDSVNESQAGKYLSLKDINPKNNLELNNSIEKVYKSYKSKNLLNEILIQPVLKNVSMSGVIFTYDNEDGSPYYCIEYDDLTGLTDTVTSGLNDKSRTLYVLRSKFRLLKSQRFLNLINATKEIEKITSFHKLDIEFGVNKKNEIFIFQVRPLVIKTIFKKKVIKKINKKILIIENFLRTSLKKSKVQNLFGVMPDWNPAEIIGITPHPLSLSLYSKMITDNVWAKSRKMLGYKNLIGNKLLRTFASHPYVNINHSFNSFLPNDLDKKISKKLINFWINDLSKNGHMHDKIEFEICTTCFDFSLRKQLLRYKNILSKKELTNYENSLKKLTKKIIFDNNHNIHLYKNNLDKLEEYRLNFNKKKLFNFSEFNKFIEYIKDYGTITFANSARIGFISENFLRSFSSQQLLTDKRIEEFKNSIVTVLGEFVHDTNDLIKKKISWKNFKEIYGHLRSGTYDIT